MSDQEILDSNETQYDDVSYLLHKIADAEKLSAEKIHKLRTLTVTLKHKVPPQHEIESCAGSHVPTREEIKEFQKYTKLVKGYYSIAEDEIIVRNWKDFCKVHNWDHKEVNPFLYLRHGQMTFIRSKKARRQFVQFLANGLPHRTLYSVYTRFRNLYDGHVRRRYKDEEDQIILNHIDKNPNLDKTRKYADLARVLRRTRQSVFSRYQLLKKKQQERFTS